MQNSPLALALLRLKDQSPGLSIISKDVSFFLLCYKRFETVWELASDMGRDPPNAQVSSLLGLKAVP